MPGPYSLFLRQRYVDLVADGKAVNRQFRHGDAQPLGKRTAVEPQLGGVLVDIILRVAAAVGLVVENFRVLIKHQYQIGDALHEHFRFGGTPLLCGGGDFGGGSISV